MRRRSIYRRHAVTSQERDMLRASLADTLLRSKASLFCGRRRIGPGRPPGPPVENPVRVTSQDCQVIKFL